MIAMAYSALGREILLPKTGRVRLNAGTMVLENGVWRTLDRCSVLVRQSSWNGVTQSTDYYERLESI